MRYFRIFLLYFQHAFVYRGRSLVWFFISLFNPLLLLLFWNAALQSGSTTITWKLPDVTAYYILLIVASSFLDVHIEENVAVDDIAEGGLNTFILKPVSYFIVKLCTELPWRIIQGFFGIVAVLIIRFLFRMDFPLVYSLSGVVFAGIIIICAFCVSFIFKMIVGISAFWTTDFSGLSQMVGVLLLLFGGFVVPLEFFSYPWKTIAMVSPFPYATYFPVLAVQGKLFSSQVGIIIGLQIIWIIGLFLLYKALWKRGLRQYTGVGL